MFLIYVIYNDIMCITYVIYITYKIYKNYLIYNKYNRQYILREGEKHAKTHHKKGASAASHSLNNILYSIL